MSSSFPAHHASLLPFLLPLSMTLTATSAHAETSACSDTLQLDAGVASDVDFIPLEGNVLVPVRSVSGVPTTNDITVVVEGRLGTVPGTLRAGTAIDPELSGQRSVAQTSRNN